tara:strand:+ start:2734 stop:3162 length:429 start_codon:yes stop_codon:yes gene_type:complete
MRKLIKDVIDKDDAKQILKECSSGNHDFSHPIITKALQNIEEVVGKLGTNAPSYARVERRAPGHKWHKDTGSNNHMTWCNIGVSILLRKSVGPNKGLFKYKEPDQSYTQDEHYLNAIVHSSDQWHKVDESDIGRAVLLMFLT